MHQVAFVPQQAPVKSHDDNYQGCYNQYGKNRRVHESGHQFHNTYQNIQLLLSIIEKHIPQNMDAQAEKQTCRDQRGPDNCHKFNTGSHLIFDQFTCHFHSPLSQTAPCEMYL